MGQSWPEIMFLLTSAQILPLFVTTELYIFFFGMMLKESSLQKEQPEGSMGETQWAREGVVGGERKNGS